MTCTVLVTGVGAIIGQGIIQSLRRADFPLRILGLDRSPDAVGKHSCDGFYVKPAVAEESQTYADFLRNLIEREQVDLLLPGIEQDVFYFDSQRQLMADWPVTVVLNTPELISLGRDKWLLHQALLREGLPAIPTLLPSTWEDCQRQLGAPPYWAKPRQGSGGRGQGLIEDEYDFAYFQRKQAPNLLMQRLVGSAAEEYTVGLFGFGDGRATAPAILRRRLGAGGATWSAETVASDAAIEAFCDGLVRAFKPIGPTNFQFRKEAEQAWLLEINPRLSASISIRAALGCNEALMSVEYFHLQRSPTFTGLHAGRCSRYIADHIEFL
ncbi:MAG: ATP-grasp domain-containing protein [Pseudomonas sp.]|uniref:ATP-grasp domain-containing protein n=1 Tax=Pseudomonas sp. TaxID=306 RepID=UPI0030F334D3